MHGQTCIFRSNLTPVSLKARLQRFINVGATRMTDKAMYRLFHDPAATVPETR